MGSKILFKNETTYTPELAKEVGDVFWEVQPAYKRRAKRFKIIAMVLAVTFAISGVIMIMNGGFSVMSIAALTMGALAVGGFFKAEGMIRGSAKNLKGLGTRTIYAFTENFFSVLSREYVGNEDENQQQALAAPEDEVEDVDETADAEEAADDASADEVAEEEANDETDDGDDAMDDDDMDEYEDEVLSLDDLLVCIVTEDLYILIWDRPYYIVDRNGFIEGEDEAFKAFIEGKAKIIEA